MWLGHRRGPARPVAPALVGAEDSMRGQGAKRLSTRSPSKCPASLSGLRLPFLRAQAWRRGGAAYWVLSETPREKIFLVF